MPLDTKTTKETGKGKYGLTKPRHYAKFYQLKIMQIEIVLEKSPEREIFRKT